MHSIYESELAHFKAAVAQGVHNAATKVLVGDEPGKKDQVNATLDQLGTANGSKLKLALYLSDSNLTAARNLVDLRIAVAPADGYWKVQDLWVEQLEQGQDVHSVNAATMSTLQGIANNGAEGAPQAHAWLAMIGSEYEEDTELPKANKRLLTDRPRERSASSRPTMLNAYPNPTNGPVYLTYTIVEGVEAAQVELHNAQGQLVRAISLGGASGIAEIQAEQLTPGIHIATLYFDGVAVGSTKVNVVR